MVSASIVALISFEVFKLKLYIYKKQPLLGEIKMRNLINRLRKEKEIIEQSLTDKTRTGIAVNELKENERKLNRIEEILGGIKGSMSRYTTIARIEYLEKTGKRKEPTI